ncbi:MAG TPA: chromate transporter [Acidocella sp.]|jgi:chromate transporter|nr:chromate transporter [Acidocella sp.]
MVTPVLQPIDNTGLAQPPTPFELCVFFCRIGLTSFGGGVSAWLLREICRNKKWVSESEFMDAFGVCQTLPGMNAMNIAIWMGYRLNGTYGAIAGVAGVTIPPAIVLILMNILLASVMGFPLTHMLLTGIAASAIGLSLSLGIMSVRGLRREVVPMVLTAVTFGAIAFLHLPLLWVVMGGAAVGITDAYFRHQRRIV